MLSQELIESLLRESLPLRLALLDADKTGRDGSSRSEHSSPATATSPCA